MTSVSLVERSIPCAQCRFDLRGTAAGTACPECGLPVIATLGGMRVDGARLVVRPGAVLPARCVKTNVPVSAKPVTKTFYWMHPGWLFTLLLGLLILLIVYLIVRKPCRFTYFISPESKRRSMLRQLAALGTAMLGIVAFVTGAINELGWIMAGGGIAFLTGLILLVIFSNVLQVTKARDGEFWIKGCGPEFLESIRLATSVPSLRHMGNATDATNVTSAANMPGTVQAPG